MAAALLLLPGTEVLTAGAARAQGTMSPETQRQVAAFSNACRADYFRLCPGVQPGGGRIIACLEEHVAKLSAPCRDAVKDAAAGTLKEKAKNFPPK